MLQEGCELIPNPEIQAATSDVHVQLVNETEWAVRDMWRREYISIVKDAQRALKSAEKKFGSKLEGLYVASHQNPDIPEWMIVCIHRFTHIYKHGARAMCLHKYVVTDAMKCMHLACTAQSLRSRSYIHLQKLKIKGVYTTDSRVSP